MSLKDIRLRIGCLLGFHKGNKCKCFICSKMRPEIGQLKSYVLDIPHGNSPLLILFLPNFTLERVRQHYHVKDINNFHDWIPDQENDEKLMNDVKYLVKGNCHTFAYPPEKRIVFDSSAKGYNGYHNAIESRCRRKCKICGLTHLFVLTVYKKYPHEIGKIGRNKGVAECYEECTEITCVECGIVLCRDLEKELVRMYS